MSTNENERTKGHGGGESTARAAERVRDTDEIKRHRNGVRRGKELVRTGRAEGSLERENPRLVLRPEHGGETSVGRAEREGGRGERESGDLRYYCEQGEKRDPNIGWLGESEESGGQRRYRG